MFVDQTAHDRGQQPVVTALRGLRGGGFDVGSALTFDVGVYQKDYPSTGTPVAIPRNSTTGVTSTINVPVTFPLTEADVTVNIDGCHIQNPNGSLVNLHEDSMTLRGNITNADIRLKSYGGKHDAGKNLLQVCGSNLRKSAYQCGTPPAPPKNLTR